MLRKWLIMGMVTLVMHGCKTTGKSTLSADIKDTLFLERTPCFGTCPQFILTIAESGNMVFEGKRFTDKNGVWKAKSGQEEVTALFSYLKGAELSQYNPEYPSPYSDLPSTIIRFHSGNNRNEIKLTGDHPAALDSIVFRIESLMKKVEWKNENLE